MSWGLDDFVNTITNVANVALNASTNIITGGTVGYDANGDGFSANAGAATRLVDEASGANSKKEDAYSKQVAADAAAAQQKITDDTNERSRMNDVRASSAAQAVRNTAFATSNGGISGTSTSTPDTTNFLGL